MRTPTTRTAVSAAVALLVVGLLCAPVWAQTQKEAIRQMATSMATMSQAMQRLAQAQPAPATQPPAVSTVPPGGCDPANCVTREEFAQLKSQVAVHERRLQKVESLVGRIAPREPAAAKPAAQPAPAVSVTAPVAERLLAVKFVGMEPNAADLRKVSDLVKGGRYEFASGGFILMPAPGATSRERGHLQQARLNALRQDVTGVALPTPRDPADDEELAQLVAGAPKDAGVVFHLRLK